MTDKPWLTEPDRLDFEAHGYDCAILRTTKLKHLCGYVGVTKTHPWYRLSYNKPVHAPERLLNRTVSGDTVGYINLLVASHGEIKKGIAPISLLVDCHCGLTYSDHGGNLGLDDDRWWFGFDCAHAGDFTPGSFMPGRDRSPFDGETYRDIEYVKRITEKVAEQLRAVEQGGDE